MKNKFKKKILSILAHPKHTTNKYTEPQQYMHAIEKKKLTPPKQHKKTNQNKKTPNKQQKSQPNPNHSNLSLDRTTASC